MQRVFAQNLIFILINLVEPIESFTVAHYIEKHDFEVLRRLERFLLSQIVSHWQNNDRSQLVMLFSKILRMSGGKTHSCTFPNTYTFKQNGLLLAASFGISATQRFANVDTPTLHETLHGSLLFCDLPITTDILEAWQLQVVDAIPLGSRKAHQVWNSPMLFLKLKS